MASISDQVALPLTLQKEDQQQTSNENATEEGITGSTFVAQHMDITEPLATLRLLLQDRLGTSLSDYVFLLQDTQQLEDSKNLVEQCVEGEGLVQINVELSNKNGIKKINIIDVLKPAEEIIALVSQPVTVNSQPIYLNYECSEEPTKWGPSANFRQLQSKHNIPADPMLWTKEHVDHWLWWAVEHFNLTNVMSRTVSWNLDGPGICAMTQEEFTHKMPIDPGNLFWTHFELLRKYKFIAVPTPTMNQAAVLAASSPPPANKKPLKALKPGSSGSSTETSTSTPSNRLGYNGQYQLWQFLLELLTDKDQCQYIQWVGEEGEFKLLEPETVAHMWGRRKNKPYMNYEKLSRALRYYYDGEMIAKVHGKRFVYKFVCDLKSMLGYSAAELDKLVTECRKKCMQQGVQNGSISSGGKMKAEPSS